MRTFTKNGITIEYERINNDMYGNPRYKIHFSYGNEIRNIENIYENPSDAIFFLKEKLNGKKFRNQNYVVWQSYNVERDLEKLFEQ